MSAPPRGHPFTVFSRQPVCMSGASQPEDPAPGVCALPEAVTSQDSAPGVCAPQRPSLHSLLPVAADPASATHLSGTGPSGDALGLKCWISCHVTAVLSRAPEHTSRCGGCGWGLRPQVTGRRCRSAQELEGVAPGRDAGFTCQGQAGRAPCSSSMGLLLEDKAPRATPHTQELLQGREAATSSTPRTSAKLTRSARGIVGILL